MTMAADDDALKEWIRREMTLEKTDILLQAKERVAALLGVSTDGAVAFRLSSDQLSKLDAKERILLYLIGKLFAKAAGYSADDTATNSELVVNLGMAEGTVKSQLSALRNSRFINPVRPGIHSIARNRLLEALAYVESKVKV